MIKQTILGLIVIGFIACNDVNSSADKTITQGGDTVSEMEISVSKLDELANIVNEADKEHETSKLLFKAVGTEPGWLTEIYNNKVRVVVDYGNDSLLVEDKFENLNSDKGFYYSAIGLPFTINIINKPCSDEASGEKMDRVVVVKFKNKEYKGCGNFIK